MHGGETGGEHQRVTRIKIPYLHVTRESKSSAPVRILEGPYETVLTTSSHRYIKRFGGATVNVHREASRANKRFFSSLISLEETVVLLINRE